MIAKRKTEGQSTAGPELQTTHLVYASSVDYMDDVEFIFDNERQRPIIDRRDCRHYRRKQSQMAREARIES